MGSPLDIYFSKLWNLHPHKITGGGMPNKEKRPVELKGVTQMKVTGCGKLFITVNKTGEGKPFEVFLNMGKAGGCASAQTEAIGRLIAYALRIGGSLEELVKELKGVNCHQPTDDCMSCADAVARVMEAQIPKSELTAPIAQSDGPNWDKI